MRKTALKLFGAIVVLVALSGCHTPHLYNPIHWGAHFAQVFGPNKGELHMLHVDLDRVLFGLTWYEEYETADPIYSR